ncbi:MAG: NADH-quinone oxidoreductase subunit C [Candidatus Margulisbacteria bacterium]|nr:NADH-quinone oxidoreductase subunit C [Candidatus Margulisiibacteriota bacterium]
MSVNKVLTYTVPADKFAGTAFEQKKKGAFLAAEWSAESENYFEVYACYRLNGEYQIVRTEISKEKAEFDSISGYYLAASRFERQIYSLMGIKAIGNTDQRPWIKFEDWPVDAWPLRKNFKQNTVLRRSEGTYDWIQAEGEGVFEIPVGPVHAGIIEPGHFRFQAVGEAIINLEERLGYVHKGIEKRYESTPWLEGYKLAGRVSGDSTVAHSLAYCIALEAMTGCKVPARAAWLRAIFLERERIANHLGDIGAIGNDAAFSILLYQLMRLKEMLLRTNQLLWGHRYVMDKIVPGGIVADIDKNGIEQILTELKKIEKEFKLLVKIYDGNPSLEERVLTTGILSKAQALELGVVGFVARASGLDIDSRVQNPFSPYDQLEIKVPVFTAGDVNARVWVRIEEVRESIRLIRLLLNNLPSGAIKTDCPLPPPNKTGFAVVEGWRGEIIYWLQSDSKGAINRCMARDPSALNWKGLEYSVLDNIVPDFPLCNKSFNASYAGNDL